MPVSGINFIFHTLAAKGGMERAVVDMIFGFARRGLPVRAIAMRAEDALFPASLKEKIEIVRVPARFPYRFSQRSANLDFENRATAFCVPGRKTISASRVPAPVDMAVSGGTHFEHLRKKNRRPGATDRRIMAHEKALYEGARVVVAHSETTRQEILDLGISPEKTVCLFPPADTERFNLAARENRERLRAEWGVPADKFVLLFPSNDHERKGAELILAALDALNDPNIVLAVASRRAIEHPRALNLGFRRDIEKCYAAADAAILASRYEPFGLVGVESVLCGTPALLSEACGATEALAEPGCFAFPLSVEGLQATLSRALERFRAGKLALARPESCIRYAYSLDAHIGELLKLLGD